MNIIDKRKSLTKNFKLLIILGTLSVGSAVLSGCANMMKSMGYETIPASTTLACRQSSILLTDLKRKDSQRQYMLPNGRLCNSQAINEVNHEQ